MFVELESGRVLVYREGKKESEVRVQAEARSIKQSGLHQILILVSCSKSEFKRRLFSSRKASRFGFKEHMLRSSISHMYA